MADARNSTESWGGSARSGLAKTRALLFGGPGLNRATLSALPLYIAFGAVLGLVQTALPVILQIQGAALAHVGLATLLYLPFGISLLWAPLVDRYQIAGAGRRRGWILLCQAIAAIFLVIAAFAPPIVSLFLLIPVALAAATMDLALDGYLVETARDDADRVRRGPLKIGGTLLGIVIGSTIILAVHERFGWTVSVLSLAALMLLAPLPFARDLEASIVNPLQRAPLKFGAVLRRAGGARLIVSNAVLAAAIGLGITSFRLLLVDNDTPLAVIGVLFGVVGSVSGIVGAGIGALSARHATPGQTLATAGLALAVLLSLPAWLPIWAPDIFSNSSFMGIFVAASYGSYAVLFGAICSIAMRWCGQQQAATDYALFQCSWTIAGIVGGAVGGFAISGLGWPTVFLIAAICTAISTWLSATTRAPARRELPGDLPRDLPGAIAPARALTPEASP